jgi:hypothetical protein
MLINVGVIPYTNNNHRKQLFRMLKSELGNDIKIWLIIISCIMNIKLIQMLCIYK